MYKASDLIPEVVTNTLGYAKRNSPFYKAKLMGVNGLPQTYAEWRLLPFTTKDDLAKNNQEFCAVKREQIADISTTSGTTGKAVSIFLTRNDLNRLARNERTSFETAGVKAGDLLQLMTTIDRQFMAGLAYYLGAQELGCGLIRTGPGLPEMQWNAILQHRPRYLIAVPSFLVSLLDHAEKDHIDPNKSGVEAVICIGEPIRNEDLSPNILHQRITERWPVKLFSTYASSEMEAAFTECEHGCGGHLNESLLFLEVLREDDEVASDGEVGELVFTTIGVEGTPLIRYRTGDLARVYTKPCVCGRTGVRIGPISGRKNQMIKFKGTTLYPQALISVLESFAEITLFKILVRRDDRNLDEVTVWLPEDFKDSALLIHLTAKFRAQIKVVPYFEFHEISYLREQVFKRELRKAEKILFEL